LSGTNEPVIAQSIAPSFFDRFQSISVCALGSNHGFASEKRKKDFSQITEKQTKRHILNATSTHIRRAEL